MRVPDNNDDASERAKLARMIREDNHRIYERDLRLMSSAELARDLESLRFQREAYLERIELVPQTVNGAEHSLAVLDSRIADLENLLAERERLMTRNPKLEQYRVSPDGRSRLSLDAKDLKRLWPIRDFCERVMCVDLDGGRNPKGRCPLPDHDDRSPSFVVYPETDSWHCFGCNRGGDIFTLTALYFNLDMVREFREVVRRVAAATPELLGGAS